MGANQSRQPQGSGPAEPISTSADGRVKIKMSDLGPEEQEIFRKFADKIKNVTGDRSAEKILKSLHEEVGQHVDEEAWMGQAYVRIGIVGVSGAGKTTFINSFRGLRACDPGAAAVGTTETTADTAEYPHPEHDYVILVDFPGALFKLKDGGRQFTENFGKTMRECNVFLVFTSDRVHDNAVWIAEKARKMNKKVLFVRSKFDRDVEDKQRDARPTLKGVGDRRVVRNDSLRSIVRTTSPN